jgi:hypothetical protein
MFFRCKKKIPPDWAGFFFVGRQHVTAGFLLTVSLFGKSAGVYDAVLFDRESLECAESICCREKLIGGRREIDFAEGHSRRFSFIGFQRDLKTLFDER